MPYVSKKLMIFACLISLLFAGRVEAQKQEFGGKRTDFVVDGHNGFIVQPLNPAPKEKSPGCGMLQPLEITQITAMRG